MRTGGVTLAALVLATLGAGTCAYTTQRDEGRADPVFVAVAVACGLLLIGRLVRDVIAGRRAQREALGGSRPDDDPRRPGREQE